MRRPVFLAGADDCSALFLGAERFARLLESSAGAAVHAIAMHPDMRVGLDTPVPEPPPTLLRALRTLAREGLLPRCLPQMLGVTAALPSVSVDALVDALLDGRSPPPPPDRETLSCLLRRSDTEEEEEETGRTDNVSSTTPDQEVVTSMVAAFDSDFTELLAQSRVPYRAVVPEESLTDAVALPPASVRGSGRRDSSAPRRLTPPVDTTPSTPVPHCEAPCRTVVEPSSSSQAAAAPPECSAASPYVLDANELWKAPQWTTYHPPLFRCTQGGMPPGGNPDVPVEPTMIASPRSDRRRLAPRPVTAAAAAHGGYPPAGMARVHPRCDEAAHMPPPSAAAVGPPRYDWEVDFTELQVEEKIGAGATATVYRAVWRGTEVAVKKMGSSIVDNANEMTKFMREIQILLKLRHPNLALLMGASIRSKPYFLVMEYCQGGDLFSLLHLPDGTPHRIQHLSLPQKLKIATDIAKGMTYLHKLSPQVVHRDLKSLNILLTTVLRSPYDEPHAKITDFGLSQLRNATGADAYQTAAVGTFHWMAPEVLMSQAYNESVDVYSFGILLYELFSQSIPYASPAPSVPPSSASPGAPPPLYGGMMMRPLPPSSYNPVNIALAVCQGYRPDLSRIPCDVPPPLISLMTACWNHDSRRRPSFEAILGVLRQYTGPQAFSSLH